MTRYIPSTFAPKGGFIDFTVALNAERFYSSMGDPTGLKRLSISLFRFQSGFLFGSLCKEFDKIAVFYSLLALAFSER